jgi:hypothetical protein
MASRSNSEMEFGFSPPNTSRRVVAISREIGAWAEGGQGTGAVFAEHNAVVGLVGSE